MVQVPKSRFKIINVQIIEVNFVSSSKNKHFLVCNRCWMSPSRGRRSSVILNNFEMHKAFFSWVRLLEDIFILKLFIWIWFQKLVEIKFIKCVSVIISTRTTSKYKYFVFISNLWMKHCILEQRDSCNFWKNPFKAFQIKHENIISFWNVLPSNHNHISVY